MEHTQPPTLYLDHYAVERPPPPAPTTDRRSLYAGTLMWAAPAPRPPVEPATPDLLAAPLLPAATVDPPEAALDRVKHAWNTHQYPTPTLFS